MVKKKRSNFKGKVADNAAKTVRSTSGFGYLRLPKGIGTFSPDPDGRYKLDFLPYVVSDAKHPDRDEQAGIALVGDLWWKRPYKRHTNIGSSNESVVCLKSVKKKCPVCEHQAELIRKKAEQEDIKALAASDRCLYIVRPLDSKKHEEKPYVFDISTWNFQNLLSQELKENDENDVFPDLEEGLTLRVRFEEKTIGKSKPFAEAGRIDFLERDEQYDETILEEVPNLDEILIIKTYDELQALLFEIDDEETGGKLKKVDDDDDDDDDDKPPRKRKTLGKKAEEEEDDDDDDEEEEEETPRRRSRTGAAKRKPKVEEEEDEEEEEEEKKPIKRGTPGTKTRNKAKEEEDEEDEPKKKVGKKSSNPCPAGYRFGVDTGKFEECDDCEVWDACMEAKRKRRA